MVVQTAVTVQKLPPTLPPGEVRLQFVNTRSAMQRRNRPAPAQSTFQAANNGRRRPPRRRAAAAAGCLNLHRYYLKSCGPIYLFLAREDPLINSRQVAEVSR